MAANYNKTIYLTEGFESTIDMAQLYPNNRVKLTTSLPAWFVDTTDTFSYSTYWTIEPPYDGTYTYTADVYLIDEPTQTGTATITLIVADVFTNIANCCSDDNTNLVWFNRQGGWQNYIFTQRFDNGVEVETPKTFIRNGVVRYSSRELVYKTKSVYVTGLTKNEIDYLETLRYSIQAYEYNTTTTAFVPILVDSESFTKYNSKDNMYEIIINYKYATQLDIQLQ